MADRVRKAALRLLDEVTEGGRMLSDAAPGALAGLEPAEAARAQRLAVSTLRQAGRADRVLGPFLRKRPPETVLNLLRLATMELAEGGAAHGVVNASVTLAREVSAPMAGLVNAVLRRVAASVPPGWQGTSAPELPKPLRKRLLAAWGKAGVQAIEAVQAEVPPLDLTPRDGATEALAKAVGGEVQPTGSVRLRGTVQVSALPGYAEGRFWVQDAAAAIPARVLDAQGGEAVLDLCAAPGGKTLQLAAAGARVTALDVSEARMERVRENLARCRMAAELVVADALDWSGGPFDAVLLDAPCSATGTIRRHPDLPFARREIDVDGLADLQARMIARAAGLVRPGGRLVFCTCSLLPDEGETQVARALEAGLVEDADALDLPWLPQDWRVGASGLRIRPDHWAGRGGIDGFFVAAFRRPGDGPPFGP